MGHWPERSDPVFEELPREEAARGLAQRRDALANTVARLPTHEAFLARALGRAPA
jgi:tryptophan halogenase